MGAGGAGSETAAGRVSSAPQFVHVVAMCQRPLVVLGKWRQAQASQSIHGTGIVRVLFVSPSGALNDPIAVGRTPGVTGRSPRVGAGVSSRRRTEGPGGAAAGGGVLGYPFLTSRSQAPAPGTPTRGVTFGRDGARSIASAAAKSSRRWIRGDGFPAGYLVFAFVFVVVGRLIIASSAGK